MPGSHQRSSKIVSFIRNMMLLSYILVLIFYIQLLACMSNGSTFIEEEVSQFLMYRNFMKSCNAIENCQNCLLQDFVFVCS